MSEADELDLEADAQDRSSASAITRLSTSTETTDESTSRTNQIEVIRKAMTMRQINEGAQVQ